MAIESTTEPPCTVNAGELSRESLDRAWDSLNAAYDALKTAMLVLADGINWAACQNVATSASNSSIVQT
jgi:hypothetical protein